MTETSQRPPEEKRKLTVLEQVICAWPLVLVAVGGAIGGACGGAAWALNTKIMQSNRPAPMRYLLVVLSGVGAAIVYFLAVLGLQALFPNFFGQR